MRIGLLSDIHGNTHALQAVLSDIDAQGGVDAYWILGDLAKLGPDPAGTLDRLRTLENTFFVRGNTDHYIVSGTMPGPSREEVAADPGLLPRFEIVARQTGWTQGIVTAAGHFEWLEALPVEQGLVLPDGSRLLGVHASPGTFTGPGFKPGMIDSEMEGLLQGCQADIVCVGHTHRPMNQMVGEVRVVNLGCVSMHPRGYSRLASYVLIDANRDGYRVRHHSVDYDRDAAIELVRRTRYPNGRFIIDGILGEMPIF